MLAIPDGQLSFSLHKDASTLAAGAVLTQVVEKRDAPIGYAGHWFTLAELILSSNDRAMVAVLYSLVTDCAALL